jgi:5-methyltetrahydropteroyltriglutamate--homocysteine methyltransferase
MSIYRAETVSFLRPDYFLTARKDFNEGCIAAAALREIEDTAIREVILLQEELGFPIVTDGEFRRENWWIDFISKIGGVAIGAGSAATAFDKSYVPKHVQTVDKLRADAPIAVSDYRFVPSATTQAAKITIPSATRMHSTADAAQSRPRPTRTSRRYSPTSPASIDAKSHGWRRPAAATCRSTIRC